MVVVLLIAGMVGIVVVTATNARNRQIDKVKAQQLNRPAIQRAMEWRGK